MTAVFVVSFAKDAEKYTSSTITGRKRTFASALKEEASQKQKAQQESQRVYDYFDNTHKFLYAKDRYLNRLRANYHFSSDFYSMSKLFSIFALDFLVCVQILLFVNISDAQDIEAVIKIESISPPVVSVRGRFLNAEAKNLAFLREYAGTENLAERFTDVAVTGRDGQAIGLKKLMPGEYVAESNYNAFNYNVDLETPGKASAAAHTSWVSRDIGVLMLDDLLPQTGRKSARINVAVPAGWKIASVDREAAAGWFVIDDIERAVFVLGTDLREKKVDFEGFELRVLFSDSWQFSDAEAAEMAREIYSDYRKLFGAAVSQKAQINLLRFPVAVSPGTWEADTRGLTITILSAEMPFKTQSLQRLHEQLRHEIFHLWVPNGLNLVGNYDWFYEGFALYQALKSGVKVNRIRFEDFLDTLSRAHSIDSMQSRRISLIDASKNRWNGANTQVYARGMLAAFLCDVAMLQNSKGKRSVEDILRKLYDGHNFSKPRQDGAAAVLKLLTSHQELRPIVDKYVKGSEKIAWQRDLHAAGIESTEENFITKLKVVPKPNGRQKDLLYLLGYNNWRNLAPVSK